jgi:ABC-type xylose transport system substrate-binding protein
LVFGFLFYTLTAQTLNIRLLEKGAKGFEMSEKEVVSRNIAIALGIICMVLAVGLVGAIANYTSIISGKDNTIASLDS